MSSKTNNFLKHYEKLAAFLETIEKVEIKTFNTSRLVHSQVVDDIGNRSPIN